MTQDIDHKYCAKVVPHSFLKRRKGNLLPTDDCLTIHFN